MVAMDVVMMSYMIQKVYTMYKQCRYIRPNISINVNWLMILCILFYGEPDIIDAIIHFLMK